MYFKSLNIEKSSIGAKSSQKNASSVVPTDDIHTISDLHTTVKQHDEHFNFKPASKIVDEKGKSLVNVDGRLIYLQMRIK